MRKLTAKTSLGNECIRFSEELLEVDLMPWQKWFLRHALELHPTETDSNGNALFRFRKVFLLVGRQNGKSTVMQVLTLWRMFVDRCTLVIGTAQDLEIAETFLRECYELAEEVDELKSEMGPLIRGAGKMAFRLNTGETYKVKATSRRGGRGLSGELVLLDELAQHQSWDAWAAVTKTTNAKDRAQIYGVSNAGDVESVVLRHFRQRAHERLGDPDGLNAVVGPVVELVPDVEDMDVDVDDSLGWFEWSAPLGCDPRDRDAWAQANPSLGYRIRESTLASDVANDPDWVFRTEVLCQWSDGSLEGPFPPGAWDACAEPTSKVAEGQRILLGLDVSWDRTMAHIGIAGERADGLPHVGIIASRAGTEWVIPWLLGPDAPPHAGVVVQARGAPASSLIEALTDAGIAVVEWGGSDLASATGIFYDTVRVAGLRHRPAEPVLDVPAATAKVRVLEGGAWVWDRKNSPTDAAPLIAVTGALWAMGRDTEPAVSVYEDRGLVSL